MSGIYKGLQSRIINKEPTALFVHYASHNLNLVLNDTVRHIPEASRCFDIVGHVYTFFGASINRWKLIVSAITLKKLCPTRWSSRNDSLKVL